MIEALGGRKFTFSIIAIFLAFLLVIIGDISSSTWIEFVKWIGGIYVVGNVINKFANK